MTLSVVTIPCLSDNYAFLLHDTASGATTLVDAPDAAPILSALSDRGWSLSHILLTHHHSDHVAGVADLVAATKAMVIGAAPDMHRLPALTRSVVDGDTVTVGGESGHVLSAPGHTFGHIAFYFPASKLVFTGDSLMAGGCGRLFEGTPKLMWATLSKLASLPPDTYVCSGHEYTASNLRFAASVDPDNPDLMARIADTTAAVAAKRPTVPSLLSLELATNPFLRVQNAAARAAMGMQDLAAPQAFAALRAKKDSF